MDENTLRKILKEELNPIEKRLTNLESSVSSIDSRLTNLESNVSNLNSNMTVLKDGQEKIIKMLTDLESKNAGRHLETSLKIEELKQVTKENCYDIVKLKAVR